MSKKIFTGILFLAVAASLLHSASAYAISWKYDLVAALKEAGDSGKPVMVDFYTEWCGWCKKLDADTYTNSNVQKLAEKFICVKVDADKAPETAARYGVSGYPTIIFLNSSGIPVEKIVGYKGPAPFAQTMSAVLGKTAAKPAGGFVVTDVPSAQQPKGKGAPKVPSVGSDFVYNGYVDVSGEDLTAQINYGGITYFVQKGDTLKEYKVVSVDKDRVVLDGKNGRVMMEFKKPVSKGDVSGVQDRKERVIAGEEIFIVGPATEDPAQVVALLIALGVNLVVIILAYVFFSLCLYFMALKTQTRHAWLAWIPVANIFLMCSIGKIRFWWLLLLLVPLVNIVIMFFMWYKIIKARGKPWWLLILLFVPLVNYVVMGYLAFSK